MASFHQHTKFGFIIGYFLSAYMLANHFFSSKLLASLVILAHFIGSFLPDLDSDSGKPFRIIFDVFGSFFALLGYFYSIQNLPGNLWALSLLPPFIFFSIRYGVGTLFKTITVHRGLFHSTPALLLSVLLTYQFLEIFSFSSHTRTILAIAVGVGFFSHLLLDTIYSASKQFHLISFWNVFKHCFKLSSSSSVSLSIVLWFTIIGLALLNPSFFQQLYTLFLN